MELDAKALSGCEGLEDLLVDDELLEMVLAFVGGTCLPRQRSTTVNLPWRYRLPTLALVSRSAPSSLPVETLADELTLLHLNLFSVFFFGGAGVGVG
jgi:hypothetical protein